MSSNPHVPQGTGARLLSLSATVDRGAHRNLEMSLVLRTGRVSKLHHFFCVFYVCLLEFLVKGTSWVSSTAIIGTWLVLFFFVFRIYFLVICTYRL